MNCINIVIIARDVEKAANLYIFVTISLSESFPSNRISLTRVIGAFLSFDACRVKSSLSMVGLDLTSLCSTIFLTLLKNKNEFIIAGSNAIMAMISDLDAIAKAPYIAPITRAPESPGNILLGYL